MLTAKQSWKGNRCITCRDPSVSCPNDRHLFRHTDIERKEPLTGGDPSTSSRFSPLKRPTGSVSPFMVQREHTLRRPVNNKQPPPLPSGNTEHLPPHPKSHQLTPLPSQTSATWKVSSPCTTPRKLSKSPAPAPSSPPSSMPPPPGQSSPPEPFRSSPA